jgi:hypothetical protein
MGGIFELNEELTNLKRDILALISKDSSNRLPKKTIQKTLAVQYDSNSIEEAIVELLDEFVIDLVVDNPSPNSELDFGHPIWFLKILSEKEIQELRRLAPIELNLLQILRMTPDDEYPGELPVKHVETELKSRGFSEKEMEWLYIKDRVEQVKTTRGKTQQRCFRIIPEYKKTEEYRKLQEEEELRVTEKELRTMRLEEEGEEK